MVSHRLLYKWIDNPCCMEKIKLKLPSRVRRSSLLKSSRSPCFLISDPFYWHLSVVGEELGLYHFAILSHVPDPFSLCFPHFPVNSSLFPLTSFSFFNFYPLISFSLSSFLWDPSLRLGLGCHIGPGVFLPLNRDISTFWNNMNLNETSM